jgi:NitT/TauT family transport system substrate-binding protein
MPSIRSTRRLHFSSFLVLATAGLLFSSCKPAPPAAPQKVEVGTTSFLSTAPLFIAQDEGYFTAQNLDVEFQTFDTAALMTPVLEQGLLDAAGDSPAIGLFNAINTTGNIKIVADKGYLEPTGCSYSAILATPDWVAKNPTLTADGIRGKRVAVEPNSVSAFIVEKLLGTVGLTLNDVQTQYLPPTALIAAAQNGSVDFINTAEPWITRLVATNKMVVWKGYQEIVPNMPIGFLDFGKRFTKDHPELGERFLTAYLQAIREYNQGKTVRNLEILAKYTKLPSDLLKQICWPSLHNDGSTDLSGLIDFQQWAVGKGKLNKVAGLDAIWDPRFVNAANKKLVAATP